MRLMLALVCLLRRAHRSTKSTALMESIVLGDGGKAHTDTLEALVKAGAHVNIPEGSGVTPLAHARGRGYKAMAAIEAAGAR